MRDARRYDEPRVCNGCGFPIGACECGSLRSTSTGYDHDPTRSGREDFVDKYVTEAVESTVFDVFGESIGHVGLFDLDDVHGVQAREIGKSILGTSVVLESSPGSFHLWNLTIRPLSEWIEISEDLAHHIEAVDPDHIALSESRGCAVLRTDEKIDMESGETVAPAPSLVRAYEPPTSHVESAPHARYLVDNFDVELADCRDRAGHHLDTRVYMAEIGGRE